MHWLKPLVGQGQGEGQGQGHGQGTGHGAPASWRPHTVCLNPCLRLYSTQTNLSLGSPSRSGGWPGSVPQGQEASSTRALTCTSTQLSPLSTCRKVSYDAAPCSPAPGAQLPRHDCTLPVPVAPEPERHTCSGSSKTAWALVGQRILQRTPSSAQGRGVAAARHRAHSGASPRMVRPSTRPERTARQAGHRTLSCGQKQ